MCMHACVRAGVHTHACACETEQVLVHVHACMHAYVQVCIHMHAHATEQVLVGSAAEQQGYYILLTTYY